MIIKNKPLKSYKINKRGYNAYINGKIFENKTKNDIILLKKGYVKCKLNNKTKDYDYLIKKSKNKTVIFISQHKFKKYMKFIYNINIHRCPDEAYIIKKNTGKTIIKILEKKEQNVEGSIETKLYSGPSLKREYEIILGNKFKIYYGYCVNNFLKKKLISKQKKYIILNKIFNENNIKILYGDDKNYFKKCNNWINEY